MISFDDLVQATHAELSQRHRKRPVSHDDVHSTLTAANLQEVMQVTSTPSRRRCLLVRQIVVKGRKWSQEDPGGTPFTYQRQLHPGVNTWIAGNSTGKSSILRVIGWALTGVKPNLKPDVESWLEEILVEVELSDLGVYTIAFQCRMEHPNVMGGIFAADIESIRADHGGASIKDFNDCNDDAKGNWRVLQCASGLCCARSGTMEELRLQSGRGEKSPGTPIRRSVTIPADTYERLPVSRWRPSNPSIMRKPWACIWGWISKRQSLAFSWRVTVLARNTLLRSGGFGPMHAGVTQRISQVAG